MGYGILAEDMLAICLLFAKGDITLPMEEIIYRVETFQHSKGFFGVSDTDFRCAFQRLSGTARREKTSSAGIHKGSGGLFENFTNLLLRDFIMPVLRFSGIWFNDEGEYWDSAREYPPSPRNLLMRRFFSRPENQTPKQVRVFLYDHGWDENLLDDARSPYRYCRYDEWIFGDSNILDKDTNDFFDFLDSPFYKDLLERKREPEKKQYRPYR